MADLLSEERLAEINHSDGHMQHWVMSGGQANITERYVHELLQHIQAQAEQLEAVRAVVAWKLRGIRTGLQPYCCVCSEDAEFCCCEAVAIRDVLGITLPVDDEGNIVDQEAFDKALAIARELEQEKI